MKGDYLFRALNQNDLLNYENKQEIECNAAVKNFSFDFAIEEAKLQVASGSTKDNSWISTSKDFFRCAEEYSIPQMGGFNNAKCRRKIAIISRNIEIGVFSQYHFNNINCTYIETDTLTLDLGDETKWPDIIKQNGCFWFSGNPCYKTLDGNHHKSISEWEKFKGTKFKKFIFDLYPTINKCKQLFVNQIKEKNKAPLHTLSLRRLMDVKLKNRKKVKSTHIVCSTSEAASEVLIANSISIKSIKKVLTFEEIDFLYAFKKLYKNNGFDGFNDILQNVIAYGLPNNSYSSSFEVDTAFQMASEGQVNILELFEQRKGTKRQNLFDFINRTFTQWDLSNPIKDYTDVSILEDAAIVAHIPSSSVTTISIKKNSRIKYDILLMQDTKLNQLYYYKSPRYTDHWNDFPDRFQIIEDGKLVDISI